MIYETIEPFEKNNHRINYIHTIKMMADGLPLGIKQLDQTEIKNLK